ncbi:beta-1,3-galactosyl-O-glycosyl-glycoprotein beta-1,6-N-acetylglucosaminyltransferase 7 [Oryzias melastigma]|uniref:Glucosaminyl (N-acetyl) transferase family member 7 n=1 Tax=Oryzias melastigma TaxID=30732 RepID=A0A3B3CBH9_ORYME|nr:beta-1,3-galactosyl-O-glycosyl-glycoprotein beta-1,6-N-acetylglucosaminyltransferase 7 [Oryzias melastigma]
MFQLGGQKWSFLFCLGISIIVVSFIYFKTRIPTEPKHLQLFGCRNFSNECKAFLPSLETAQWYRRDCQVENHILKNNLQCSELIRDLHFITRPLSREEEDYPLAFIVTIHKDLEMFVRTLRAIYMPQNVYCIHIDAKASWEYKVAVRMLVRCFENIFLSSQSEKVTYGGFTRLQADVNCMKDLVRSKIDWKKVVNLCGQDFPIKSNLELVQYMQSKQWRDKNLTPGVKQPAHISYRTEFQHKEIAGSRIIRKGGRWKKDPPPDNLQIYFGTAYYALTRAFVEFVLESPIAINLLKWSRDTYSPDEHYWVTLNHLKDAPGSRIDGGWEGDIRAIKWRDQEGMIHQGCKGHYLRDICIYGMGDIGWIIDKDSMFANKFESDAYPEALDCLEQWHRSKVLSQANIPLQPSWFLAITSNFSSITTSNSTTVM